MRYFSVSMFNVLKLAKCFHIVSVEYVQHPDGKTEIDYCFVCFLVVILHSVLAKI